MQVYVKTKYTQIYFPYNTVTSACQVSGLVLRPFLFYVYTHMNRQCSYGSSHLRTLLKTTKCLNSILVKQLFTLFTCRLNRFKKDIQT